MVTPLELYDVVRLRKPHACGGYEWQVVRLGADIGLKCRTCGRRILLTRRDLERRLVSRTAAVRGDGALDSKGAQVNRGTQPGNAE
jgi:hypothetical protein